MNFEFFEVLPNTEDIAFSADIGLFDIVDMCYIPILSYQFQIPKFREIMPSSICWKSFAQEMYNYIAERPAGVTLEESNLVQKTSKNP